MSEIVDTLTTIGFLSLQVVTVHRYRTSLRYVLWLNMRPVCKRHWLPMSTPGGGSTVSPTSRDWQPHIHSPPGSNLTRVTSDYQRVNYRPCYDLTGWTLSWMGEWEKRNRELPLKSRVTECVFAWNTLSEKDGGCFHHLGKCNQQNWPNFRLKSTMHNWHFLNDIFDPFLPKRKLRIPEGMNWGLFTLEEEIRVRVVHFFIFKNYCSAREIALYSKNNNKR